MNQQTMDWDGFHTWFFSNVEQKNGKALWRVSKSQGGALLQPNYKNPDPQSSYTALVDYLSSIIRNGVSKFSVGIISDPKDRNPYWYPVDLKPSHQVAIAGTSVTGTDTSAIGKIAAAEKKVIEKELEWTKKWMNRDKEDETSNLQAQIDELKENQKKGWEKLLDHPLVSGVLEGIIQKNFDLPQISVSGTDIIQKVSSPVEGNDDDDVISKEEQLLLHYRSLLIKQGIEDVDKKFKNLVAWWVNNPAMAETLFEKYFNADNSNSKT